LVVVFERAVDAACSIPSTATALSAIASTAPFVTSLGSRAATLKQVAHWSRFFSRS
jgi:hypothetical protein